MPKFIVKGGQQLNGEIKVSGSKNATLPILCASLLTDEMCEIGNVPDIEDIRSMLQILRGMGSSVEFSGGTVKIQTLKLGRKIISEELICKMRASILLLGPLLGRQKKAEIPFPGGCILGKRSVFAHTNALSQLNCQIIDETKTLHLLTSELKGADITMPELSVTATENLLMAAVLADGKTKIRLAAAEPHVQDLCHFLNKMGAKIKGIGTNILEIEGVQKLHGVKYKVTGDYLEAGTFAIAAAITNGNVTIKGINPHDLDSFWQKLAEAGVTFVIGQDFVEIKSSAKLNAVKMLRTAVYPSFPTDLQAPFAVLMSQANGVSKIFETLFEGRLNYLFELEKMGAKVEILNPHQAIVIGPTPLRGVPISSCDIRAGAAMVIAALAAEGKTEISNIAYIDRGYENMEEKLRSLGASITRVDKSDEDREKNGLVQEDRSDRFLNHQIKTGSKSFLDADD